MSKFSWNQCTQFAAAAQNVITRAKNKETKLTYAISRIMSRIQKQQADVNEALADIEVDHCVTEKRGEDEVIVRDTQGNLQYTREGIKQRNAATKEYLNKANHEIEPYFATHLPADLSVFEIEALTGFVITTEDAERLLMECEARADRVPEPGDNGHRAQVAALA
jgi:hypothetical protein